jgi:hypothetical protein
MEGCHPLFDAFSIAAEDDLDAADADVLFGAEFKRADDLVRRVLSLTTA